MRHPRGYDEHREQELKVAREYKAHEQRVRAACENDVCYWPRCSCEPTVPEQKP